MGENQDMTGQPRQVGQIVAGLELVKVACHGAMAGDPLATTVYVREAEITDRATPVEFIAQTLYTLAHDAIQGIHRLMVRADNAEDESESLEFRAVEAERVVTELRERVAELEDAARIGAVVSSDTGLLTQERAIKAVHRVLGIPETPGGPPASETAPEDVYDAYAAAQDAEDAAFHAAMRVRRRIGSMAQDVEDWIAFHTVEWRSNGDHPQDGYVGEGLVIRRYRRPDVSGDAVCPVCINPVDEHGWIDSGGDGQTVCPGDRVTLEAPYRVVPRDRMPG